jgi:hypothetical protein
MVLVRLLFFSEHVDAIEQELKELKKQLRNLEN